MTIYVPGKVTLAKEFTPQSYMYDFPSQYPVWTPADIDTALWLDANDAATITQSSNLVSQWNDKSGNARHATASSTGRPTYGASSMNSRPGLTFNGSANFMAANAVATISSGDDLPFSVFAVIDPSGNGIAAGFGSSLDGEIRFHSFSVEGDRLTTRRRGAGTDLLDLAGTTTLGPACIGELLFTGTNATLFLNGTQEATGNLNVSTLFVVDRFTIGALVRSSVSNFFNGVISEVIITANSASTNTRQRIEGYLAHKWGLTANLPSDHPYKLVGPTP